MLSNIEKKKEKALVTIKGAITFQTTNELKNVIRSAIKLNRNIVEINFKGVIFLDGFGLSLLVTLSREAYKQNRILSLTHLSPDVKKVFTKVKMDRWFDIK